MHDSEQEHSGITGCRVTYECRTCEEAAGSRESHLAGG